MPSTPADKHDQDQRSYSVFRYMDLQRNAPNLSSASPLSPFPLLLRPPSHSSPLLLTPSSYGAPVIRSPICKHVRPPVDVPHDRQNAAAIVVIGGRWVVLWIAGPPSFSPVLLDFPRVALLALPHSSPVCPGPIGTGERTPTGARCQPRPRAPRGSSRTAAAPRSRWRARLRASGEFQCPRHGELRCLASRVSTL